MNKIIALDLGDVWTGIALSDNLHIISTPYKTVKTEDLVNSLGNILKEENIDTIVLGLPKTLKGTESLQTKKSYEYEKILKDKFKPEYKDLKFILWDERLTSVRASKYNVKYNKQSKKSRDKLKEDKIKSHARAASFILDSYLNFLK